MSDYRGAERGTQAWTFWLLPAAACLVYLAAVLISHPYTSSDYNIETADCLPAALSHLEYHAPWGEMNPVLLQDFLKTSSGQASIGSAFAAVHNPSVVSAPPASYKLELDGNGVGCLVFASVMLKVMGFGPYVFTYGFLLLVVLSAVAFLLRFRDSRALMMTVVFGALTILLLTPLSTSTWGLDQAPLGGFRYFVAAATLPALHIYFETTDRTSRIGRTRYLDLTFLGLQTLLLAVVIMVRSEASALVLGLLIVWGVRLWRGRHDRPRLRQTFTKVAVVLLVASVYAVALTGWFVNTPLRKYPILGTVGHRSVISLGANPYWPFPGIRQMYPCQEAIPAGIVPGIVDQNGACIWASYELAHGKSLDAFYTPNNLYDDEYEVIVLGAFFHIVRKDPVDVLVTYLFYKPKLIVDVAGTPFHLQAGRAGVPAVASIAEIALLAGFVVELRRRRLLGSTRTSSDHVRPLWKPFALFLVCTLVPYIEAWCSVQDGTALFLYELTGVLLVGAIGLEAVLDHQWWWSQRADATSPCGDLDGTPKPVERAQETP